MNAGVGTASIVEILWTALCAAGLWYPWRIDCQMRRQIAQLDAAGETLTPLERGEGIARRMVIRLMCLSAGGLAGIFGAAGVVAMLAPPTAGQNVTTTSLIVLLALFAGLLWLEGWLYAAARLLPRAFGTGDGAPGDGGT